MPWRSSAIHAFGPMPGNCRMSRCWGLWRFRPGRSAWAAIKRYDPQAYDDEIPPHQLTLSRYYMARYPVTVAQFRAFVEASGYRLADGDSLQGLPNHPVT